MPEKTERSNCRFIVQLYQDTISSLKNSVVGFDLLGGLRPDAARKLADTLNEHILDLFVTVTVKESSPGA